MSHPNNLNNPNNLPFPGTGQYPRRKVQRRRGCASGIACLLLMTILFGVPLFFGVLWGIPLLLSNESVVMALEPVLPRISISTWLTLSLAITAVAFLIALVSTTLLRAMSVSRGTSSSGSMGGRILGSLLFASVVGVVSLAVGGPLASLPYTLMTRTGFTATDLSITTGNVIHVSNAADNVPQFLCIGHDEQCQPKNGAPTALNQGVLIQPGQSMTFLFDTAGTYTITSKTTPHMNFQVNATTDN